LLQSSVTGCAGVASLEGETSVGALGTGGFTVNVAVRVTPPYTAEIVADVDAVTDEVVTVKFALVDPAGTVTLVGTDVALESSESDTAAPPLGAAALSVTVPADEVPPTTVVGLTARVASVTADGGGGGGGGGGPTGAPEGFTVSVADRVTPL
jgi:hypothetical protein